MKRIAVASLLCTLLAIGSRGPSSAGSSNPQIGSVQKTRSATTDNDESASNNVMNVGRCRSNAPPSWCSGSDVSEWVKAAFSQCRNSCRVKIPTGVYEYSTTISVPVAHLGSIALSCDAGAVLNYMGTGDAIAAIGSAHSAAGIVISGCVIRGTKSGTNGIHTQAFNGATITGVTVQGFANGNGILNEGSNQIDILYSQELNNRYGIHNVGICKNGIGFSANVIRVIGGQIASNSGYGVFEDGSKSSVRCGSAVGPNTANSYSTTFDFNGSSGGIAASAYLQFCNGCSIVNSYLEESVGLSANGNITIGDSSYQPKNITIRGNTLASAAATKNSIDDVNSIATVVEGNIELGADENFYYHGDRARLSVLGCGNSAQAVTKFINGSDMGTDTYSCNSAWPNGFGPTVHGLGFNMISGLNQDLVIRTRGAGSDSAVFENQSGAATVRVNDNGGLQLAATAIDSLPPPSRYPGMMFYVKDSTPITSEGQICKDTSSRTAPAIAISNGSVWKCF